MSLIIACFRGSDSIVERGRKIERAKTRVVKGTVVNRDLPVLLSVKCELFNSREPWSVMFQNDYPWNENWVFNSSWTVISFCVFYIFLEAPYLIEIVYWLAGYSRPKIKACLSLGHLSQDSPIPPNFLCFPFVPFLVLFLQHLGNFHLAIASGCYTLLQYHFTSLNWKRECTISVVIQTIGRSTEPFKRCHSKGRPEAVLISFIIADALPLHINNRNCWFSVAYYNLCLSRKILETAINCSFIQESAKGMTQWSAV